MAVEYDLIVVGDTRAGIYAAVAATLLNARVALIAQQPANKHSHGIYSRTLMQTAAGTRGQGGAGEEDTGTRGRVDAGRIAEHNNSPSRRVSPSPRQSRRDFSSSPSLGIEWAEEVIWTLAEQDSPAVLASLGVDVITGAGEFSRDVAFLVNNRRLLARAYLIATGTRPVIPDIDGLPNAGYITPTEIWQPERLESLPKRLAVIGGTPMGTELAQSLARMGREVTLVVGSTQVLPPEDSETSRLVRAQLEAEGVRVLTETPVTEIKQIQESKWVQAGSRAIESDEIILAAGTEPEIEGLNLEAVGVRFWARGIKLNQKLQTTNPRIYACGGVAGGYPFDHIAQYEAGIALKNALFLPLFKVNYRSIPWAIFTEPQLARVGLTEVQARRRYSDILIVRQEFKSIAQALVLGEMTGFCKFVVRRNGEILGVHIVGPEASELMGEIALAMRNKIKMDAIANLPHPSLTLSEITQKTAIEWQRQRLHRNQTLKKFLDSFFNLRRNWSN